MQYITPVDSSFINSYFLQILHPEFMTKVISIDENRPVVNRSLHTKGLFLGQHVQTAHTEKCKQSSYVKRMQTGMGKVSLKNTGSRDAKKELQQGANVQCSALLQPYFTLMCNWTMFSRIPVGGVDQTPSTS